jgi:RNA ligase
MVKMTDFQQFRKIPHFKRSTMSITQKIHGSNAQVFITEKGEVKAGSRSRWLAPTKNEDNYGFARFVEDHKDLLIEKLGPGRHYGEWAGPGINGGEGLTEKKLVLFNWRRWKDQDISSQITTVPLLYHGRADYPDAIAKVAMDQLKKDGSVLVPGFMQPEGIVIEIGDSFYKWPFQNEEVKWKGIRKEHSAYESIDVSHLLQPVRLEKILSRDEQLKLQFPTSISDIVSLYLEDLDKEELLTGTEEEIKTTIKALKRQLFNFIKSEINGEQ